MLTVSEMKRLLEICAGDICSVAAAAAGGADRVELCSALALGGVTPSEGFVRRAVKYDGLKCHVLIRPREGDFIYSPEEGEVMLADVEMAARCGAAGVALGALRPDATVDTVICGRLIDRARELGLSVTFHRAFDLVGNPMEALETVVALGADRILTSGLAFTALEGAQMLRRLMEAAAGRIGLIAAAGVNSGNAAQVLGESGCREIHASARSLVESPMMRRGDVAMGADASSDYSRLTTDVAEVMKIVKAIGCI